MFTYYKKKIAKKNKSRNRCQQGTIETGQANYNSLAKQLKRLLNKITN